VKKLYVLATPIGNFLDLSERAKQVLSLTEAVLAEDTRVTSKLLFKLGLKKPIYSCYKFNETKVSENIGELFDKYNTLVLVSDAGTPAISDPGAIVVKKARELGIIVEAIPGASAVVTSLSLAGVNKTEFAFVGFFPRVNKEKNELIKNMQQNFISTFVFYESPKRIVETIEFVKNNLENINQICVFNDLTKEYEKHYVGNISKVLKELKENENVELGEYVVVLDLNKMSKQEQLQLSLEALIIDYVKKNNSSLKTAVSELTKLGLNKNDLYKASLNLKNILS